LDELSGEQFSVLADSAVARENMTLLAENRCYCFQAEKAGGGEFRLLLTPLGK